jgi:hypothetical protein
VGNKIVMMIMKKKEMMMMIIMMMLKNIEKDYLMRLALIKMRWKKE